MLDETVQQQGVVLSLEANDFQKEEWQECRSVIARLDNTLVDLRKTVFGLASGLLTAGGILGGIANLLPGSNNGTTNFAVSSSVVAVLVSVTMVLINVFFVVDRYYSMLQWSAMRKALALEETLPFKMTRETLLKLQSQSWWTEWVVLLQYGSFVLVSIVLGLVVVGWNAMLSLSFAAVLMFTVSTLSLTLIVLLFHVTRCEWSNLELEDEGSVFHNGKG